jgi:protein TonB
VEEAKDNPSPLSLIGSAASAAVPSFRSSQSAGEPPSPAAIEYGRIVRSHVNQNRIYPQQDRSTPIFGTAVVHFFLLPDGRLKNVEIVHSSGNDIIDRVAIESIQRATPFPPVPPNVATEMMDVTVYMRY